MQDRQRPRRRAAGGPAGRARLPLRRRERRDDNHRQQDLLPLRAPAGQLPWLPAGVPAAAGKRAAAHGSAGQLRQRAGQKILTEALRHFAALPSCCLIGLFWLKVNRNFDVS